MTSPLCTDEVWPSIEMSPTPLMMMKVSSSSCECGVVASWGRTDAIALPQSGSVTPAHGNNRRKSQLYSYLLTASLDRAIFTANLRYPVKCKCLRLQFRSSLVCRAHIEQPDGKAT